MERTQENLEDPWSRKLQESLENPMKKVQESLDITHKNQTLGELKELIENF